MPLRGQTPSDDMTKLQDTVIDTIIQAILKEPIKLSILHRVFIFFALIRIPLQRFRKDIFKKLRHEAWAIDEDGYRRSFEVQNEEGRSSLHSLSELGYSGSVDSLYHS